MLLSLKYNFLFVHIAKTGGTSVRASLQGRRWRDPWYWPMFLCSRLSHLSGHRIATKLPRHAKAVAAGEMTTPDETIETGFFRPDELPSPMVPIHGMRIEDGLANQECAAIR